MARFTAFASIGFSISCAGSQRAAQQGYEFDSPTYRECVAGKLDSCAAHAAKADASKDPSGRRTALVAYQYGCLLDHAPSCAGLARLLGDAATGSASADRFRDALESACEGAEPSACVELARHSSGRRAQTLYQRACDANYGPGCFELGKILRQVWKLETQLLAGIQLQEKACELGTVEGCVAAGQAYLFGSGVDQNPEHGLELLERGCTPDEGSGCATLASLYEQGIGVRADAERAQHYNDLASRHSAGTNGVGQGELSFVVYAEACTRGNVLGCFDAGWLRAEGVEVERNITVARQFFESACQSGLEPACDRWKSVAGETP